jgi:hypothetical protein
MKYWRRMSDLGRGYGIVCWRNRDGMIRTVWRYGGRMSARRGTASGGFVRTPWSARTDAYAFAAHLHRSDLFAPDCW